MILTNHTSEFHPANRLHKPKIATVSPGNSCRRSRKHPCVKPVPEGAIGLPRILASFCSRDIRRRSAGVCRVWGGAERLAQLGTVGNRRDAPREDVKLLDDVSGTSDGGSLSRKYASTDRQRNSNTDRPCCVQVAMAVQMRSSHRCPASANARNVNWQFTTAGRSHETAPTLPRIRPPRRTRKPPRPVKGLPLVTSMWTDH